MYNVGLNTGCKLVLSVHTKKASLITVCRWVPPAWAALSHGLMMCSFTKYEISLEDNALWNRSCDDVEGDSITSRASNKVSSLNDAASTSSFFASSWHAMWGGLTYIRVDLQSCKYSKCSIALAHSTLQPVKVTCYQNRFTFYERIFYFHSCYVSTSSTFSSCSFLKM